MKLQCFFDGSIGPKNPGGTASYGFVINSGGVTIKTGRGVVGTGPAMSNNVAEASGLIAILECVLLDFPAARQVDIFGDSNIVIEKMKRHPRNCGKGLYSPYIRIAKELAIKLRASGVDLYFIWIPRVQNSHADKLADYRTQLQTLDAEYIASGTI